MSVQTGGRLVGIVTGSLLAVD